MRKYKWMTALLLACCLCLPVFAEEAVQAETEAKEEIEGPERIGDIQSGNQGGEVHNIKLYENVCSWLKNGSFYALILAF